MSDLPGPSGLQKFSSPKKKRMRKSSLSASEKVVICNIYILVEEMWPKDQFMYSKDVAMKTAETAGVHISHTKSKVWQDFSIETARQAYQRGLSTGLKGPSGKGKRLIILHIGNEDGFVENGHLIFESKRGDGDYHQEMNSKIFEEWFFAKINEPLAPPTNAGSFEVKVPLNYCYAEEQCLIKTANNRCKNG
ncbi:hypothetical protein ACJJTC_014121 [Scirpophaga incertulas]